MAAVLERKANIWPTVWLAAAWIAGAALVWNAQRSGRSSPSEGTFGANGPSEAWSIFRQLTLEVLILVAFIRPWSYRGSWRRALSALLLFLPLGILLFIATQHSGTVGFAHLLWVWLIVAALFAVMLLSGASAARKSRAPVT